MTAPALVQFEHDEVSNASVTPLSTNSEGWSHRSVARDFALSFLLTFFPSSVATWSIIIVSSLILSLSHAELSVQNFELAAVGAGLLFWAANSRINWLIRKSDRAVAATIGAATVAAIVLAMPVLNLVLNQNPGHVLAYFDMSWLLAGLYAFAQRSGVSGLRKYCLK